MADLILTTFTSNSSWSACLMPNDCCFRRSNCSRLSVLCWCRFTNALRIVCVCGGSVSACSAKPVRAHTWQLHRTANDWSATETGDNACECSLCSRSAIRLRVPRVLSDQVAGHRRLCESAWRKMRSCWPLLMVFRSRLFRRQVGHFPVFWKRWHPPNWPNEQHITRADSANLPISICRKNVVASSITWALTLHKTKQPHFLCTVIDRKKM